MLLGSKFGVEIRFVLAHSYDPIVDLPYAFRFYVPIQYARCSMTGRNPHCMSQLGVVCKRLHGRPESIHMIFHCTELYSNSTFVGEQLPPQVKRLDAAIHSSLAKRRQPTIMPALGKIIFIVRKRTEHNFSAVVPVNFNVEILDFIQPKNNVSGKQFELFFANQFCPSSRVHDSISQPQCRVAFEPILFGVDRRIVDRFPISQVRIRES